MNIFLIACLVLFGQPKTLQADQILVLKSKHQMELLRGETVLKEYKIALGPNPIGAKTQQGDGRTPEGDYRIDSKNAQSRFYKSLHISYPTQAQRAKAKAMGVDPGGDIMIHGLGKKFGWIGSAHRLHDWTNGCIAVTNEEMDEIWRLVSVGTKVTIRP